MAADVTVGMTTGNRAGGTSASPAAPAPPSANGSGPAPAGPATPQRAEDVPDEAQRAPVMPGLSASDRAAIASATGFYISASGKVTPEGIPRGGSSPATSSSGRPSAPRKPPPATALHTWSTATTSTSRS